MVRNLWSALTYSYYNVVRIVFTMQVLKCACVLKLCYSVQNCVAQFRNWVAIFKSEDNFGIGTQFQVFKLRNANSKLHKFTYRAEHIRAHIHVYVQFERVNSVRVRNVPEFTE